MSESEQQQQEEEEEENGPAFTIPRPRQTTIKAVPQAKPQDLHGEIRSCCYAFLCGQICDENKTACASLPRELYAEILQLLFPIHSKALQVGPHLKGEVWLGEHLKLAVCKLGPSIVRTEESISSGKLIARLAFFGSKIFCVGAIDVDSTSSPDSQWYNKKCDGMGGFFNKGSGCALRQADFTEDEMPIEVILDADKREVSVVSGEKLFITKIHESVSSPFCIAATLWAGCKLKLLTNSSETHTHQDEK